MEEGDSPWNSVSMQQPLAAEAAQHPAQTIERREQQNVHLLPTFGAPKSLDMLPCIQCRRPLSKPDTRRAGAGGQAAGRDSPKLFRSVKPLPMPMKSASHSIQ